MARDSISPCKGCDHRTEGCHAICMEYFAWKLIDEECARDERRKRNNYVDADSFRIHRAHCEKKRSRVKR